MTDAPDDKPKDAVASIAAQIAKSSTGDRAALRRIYLTESYQAHGVVIRLLHHAGVNILLSKEAIAPWRLLIHVAALLSGTGGGPAHAPTRQVGSALQAIRFSENRLLRLTAARGAALYDQIIFAARMLAQRGEASVNLWTLFQLAGRDPARAEEARIRIAQDYYAAAVRSGGDAQ